VSNNSILENEDFKLVQEDYCLVGSRSGKKFRMGDKVWIKVVAANLTKRQLDYEWVIHGAIDSNLERKRKKPQTGHK
jgi:ribonuclease R